MNKTLCALLASSLFLGCAGAQKKSSKYETDNVGPGWDYQVHKDARGYVDQVFYLKGIKKEQRMSEEDRKKMLGVYLLMDGYPKDDANNVVTKKEAEAYVTDLKGKLQKRLRKAEKESDDVDITGFR